VKIAFPNNISPPSQAKSCRALTILEMLVSTAMLAFIVLGLTAMFIQVQKAFKTGIKQTTVTDAGRTILDMIASDLSQTSDPHFTNVFYPTNSTFGSAPTLYWFWSGTNTDLAQSNYNNGVLTPFRTNNLEDIFTTIQTNNTWIGVGYTVSNWFAIPGSGNPFPGIGTLYRYVATVNGPLVSTNNSLFTNFVLQINSGTLTNTLFHRVADGVVGLKIYAYDADGNEMYWEPYYDQNGYVQDNNFNYLQYPVNEWETNSLGVGTLQTVYLPHSIDIELAMLEPEAFEHARALFTAGAIPAAEAYLTTNCSGQVEIFRQHIIIPAAP
jgi:type II secretory pathway pseudopilin PulG